MKKIIFLFVLFIVSVSIQAQNISVKSFKVLPMDQTARITHPVIDQNGEKCALIKVVTTQQGMFFEGGMLGIMKRLWKNGEYWVYIPHGAKKITIKHDHLGVLRNYIYPEAITEATVYEMVLTSGKVKTIVEQAEIESLWLMVTSDPTDAELYIDNTYVGQTPFQKKLKKQKYNYRLSKEKYKPGAGILDLRNVTDKKLLGATLKPDFGSLRITTTPENGAEVFLDGNSTGQTTPCTLQEVTTGDHRIRLRRDWYQPKVEALEIKAGEAKELNIELVPSYGELKITTDPKATIYIDNQRKGFGEYSCRLSPGVYSIKAQKDKHRDAEQSIEIAFR